MPKIFYNELHNRFNAHYTKEKQLTSILDLHKVSDPTMVWLYGKWVIYHIHISNSQVLNYYHLIISLWIEYLSYTIAPSILSSLEEKYFFGVMPDHGINIFFYRYLSDKTCHTMQGITYFLCFWQYIIVTGNPCNIIKYVHMLWKLIILF